MKYIPLIFAALGTICGLGLALINFHLHHSEEATAWAISATWSTNCMIHEIKAVRDGH